MMRDVSRHSNSPEIKTTFKQFLNDCCYVKIAILQNTSTQCGLLVPLNKLKLSYFFRTQKKARRLYFSFDIASVTQASMLGTHITYSFTPGHFMIQKTWFQKQKKKWKRVNPDVW